jgi:PhnB protein
MTKAVKPIPEGYHSITNHLVVKDVAEAVEFYKRALGAVERYRMLGPDGKSIMHAELKIGDSLLMVGREMEGCQSAQTLGGSPVAFYIYVNDADTAYKKAIDAGGKESQGGLEDMFWGDRCGTFVDPFGLQWSIATRLEDLTHKEIEERAKAFFAKAA